MLPALLSTVLRRRPAGTAAPVPTSLLTVALCAIAAAALAPCRAALADEPLPPPVRRVLRPGAAQDVPAPRPPPPVLPASGVLPAAPAPAPPRVPPLPATLPAASVRTLTPGASPAHDLRPDARQPAPAPRPEAPRAESAGAPPAAADEEASAVAPPQAAPVDLAHAVERLTSPDFLDRMRAARELVEAGEAALPFLGAAGPLTVRGPGGLPMSATRGVLESIFEALEDARVRAWLRARWPEVRRAATAELGRRRAVAAIPDLIDGLADGTPCVRAAAVAALRSCSGQWFGYDAESSVGVRQRAIGRWRGWWATTARAPGAAPGATPPARHAR